MRQASSWFTPVAVALILVLPALAGCGAASPTPAVSAPTSPAATKAGSPAVQATATSAAATQAATTASGPTSGGTLVWAVNAEATSLDPHHSLGGSEGFINWLLGAALVCLDPKGDAVPWIAESWTVSEDALVYTFKLRKDVKFHDGTNVTAKDYVWTIQRALDPATNATIAADYLSSVQSAEAPDDYTLVLALEKPHFAFLISLSEPCVLSPLSQAWVERWGDDFDHHPMSVEPYKLKEWVLGDRIVLERNPDYTWAPEAFHKGAAYFDFVEFRYVPENAALIAGLEAGEFGFAELNEVKDAKRIRDTGQYDMLETVFNGASPYLALNVSRTPLDDLRVRQALSMAVDREALVQIVMSGSAVPQYGPISAAVPGYWSDADSFGRQLYPFDLAKAKSLMTEAGWTDSNGDGVLDKDGKPLKLTIMVRSGEPSWSKTAEVLQEQLAALGMRTNIELQEVGMSIDNVIGGEYEMAVFAYDMSEFDFCHTVFHSEAANIPHAQDAELDSILGKTRTTIDGAQRQEWVNAAQKRIIEQAYQVSLFAPKKYVAVSKRIKGYVWAPPYGPFGAAPFFDDAYIQK